MSVTEIAMSSGGASALPSRSGATERGWSISPAMSVALRLPRGPMVRPLTAHTCAIFFSRYGVGSEGVL